MKASEAVCFLQGLKPELPVLVVTPDDALSQFLPQMIEFAMQQAEPTAAEQLQLLHRQMQAVRQAEEAEPVATA